MHSSIQAFKHSNIQAFKQSNIQAIKHSSNQTFKQSNNQAIKQSNNQTIKQSNIQAIKHFLTSLLFCFAAAVYAQPDCLRTQWHGIESPNCYHTIVWVCTGDTLSVDTNAYGEVITTVGGFWITCEELTRDVWRWYSFSDRNVADDDSLPVTGIDKKQVDTFLDIFNKSLRQQWRLPTREEWLFAFRGGLFGGDYAFSGSNRHVLVAWSKSNSGGRLHPVGERIANVLDIHDMSGNVSEMVTVGDSIVCIGGCYLDDMESGERSMPKVDFPMPPPEAVGFRIIYPEPLKFNRYCERVF
ncbi:MAG: SUMF1/EgtB/PvdO family nonheme iron enzyme [Bacteroidales bacterium]|nr:SUMF1/EgtB/PvdO family nonheme iron enzyme [Bacteroidales bacterium]